MCVKSQSYIPEISRFQHLISHRENYERVYVAALTIHFDDSGTAPDQPIAVVAGWVSPVVQWIKFIRDWKKAELEYGFATFHMAEFIANNPKSEFADKNVWSGNHKKRAMLRLRYIIQQHAVQGFGVSVIKQDYDELVQGKLRKDTGEYHYTWAIRSVIGRVEKWRSEHGIKEPIEYIFDRMAHKRSKEEINLVFEQAESLPDSLHRYGIYKGCHSFRDKTEVLPLQAADILAWLLYRREQYRNSGLKLPAIAVDTFNYFNSRGLMAVYQTRKQLEEWVASRPELRQP
ncbi:MAG: DUF3800 domain-containing protein [Terriglobales bacterium]